MGRANLRLATNVGERKATLPVAMEVQAKGTIKKALNLFIPSDFDFNECRSRLLERSFRMPGPIFFSTSGSNMKVTELKGRSPTLWSIRPEKIGGHKIFGFADYLIIAPVSAAPVSPITAELARMGKYIMHGPFTRFSSPISVPPAGTREAIFMLSEFYPSEVWLSPKVITLLKGLAPYKAKILSLLYPDPGSPQAVRGWGPLNYNFPVLPPDKYPELDSRFIRACPPYRTGRKAEGVIMYEGYYGTIYHFKGAMKFSTPAEVAILQRAVSALPEDGTVVPTPGGKRQKLSAWGFPGKFRGTKFLYLSDQEDTYTWGGVTYPGIKMNEEVIEVRDLAVSKARSVAELPLSSPSRCSVAAYNRERFEKFCHSPVCTGFLEKSVALAAHRDDDYITRDNCNGIISVSYGVPAPFFIAGRNIVLDNGDILLFDRREVHAVPMFVGPRVNFTFRW